MENEMRRLINLLESATSEYFTRVIDDTDGAKHVYPELEKVRTFGLIYNDQYRTKVFLVTGVIDGRHAYGYYVCDGSDCYSIDNKLHYDFKNLDRNIEGLLQF